MDKIPIQQIADVLQRRGISATEAADFVSTLFDVVKESLVKESLVKVRGLGTFKVVGVGARQSVSVNTGERIVIDGHEKISFIPDSEMREMVNRPFAQFDTVVLNEGVSFDKISPVIPETHEIPETREISERPEKTEALEMLEYPEKHENIETTETPNIAGKQELHDEQEILESSETIDETNKTNSNMSNGFEKESHSKGWIVWLLLILVMAGGTYYIGYQQGRTNDNPEYVEANAPKLRPELSSDVHGIADEDNLANNEHNAGEDMSEENLTKQSDAEAEAKEEALKAEKEKAEREKAEAEAKEEALKAERERAEREKAEKAKADALKAEKAKADKAKTDALKAEKAKADKAKADALKAEKAKADKAKAEALKAQAAAKKEKTKTTKKETVSEDGSKYEEADSRLRSGSYSIVGTERVVTVRRGEDLYRIARRELGNNNLVCYLSAFNGMTDDQELVEGQQIKIPKLKWKLKSSK